MFGATVTNPLVMSKFLCIGEEDNLVKSELIGTIFFVSGICTLLQSTLGTRSLITRSIDRAAPMAGNSRTTLRLCQPLVTYR